MPFITHPSQMSMDTPGILHSVLASVSFLSTNSKSPPPPQITPPRCADHLISLICRTKLIKSLLEAGQRPGATHSCFFTHTPCEQPQLRLSTSFRSRDALLHPPLLSTQVSRLSTAVWSRSHPAQKSPAVAEWSWPALAVLHRQGVLQPLSKLAFSNSFFPNDSALDAPDHQPANLHCLPSPLPQVSNA